MDVARKFKRVTCEVTRNVLLAKVARVCNHASRAHFRIVGGGEGGPPFSQMVRKGWGTRLVSLFSLRPGRCLLLLQVLLLLGVFLLQLLGLLLVFLFDLLGSCVTRLLLRQPLVLLLLLLLQLLMLLILLLGQLLLLLLVFLVPLSVTRAGRSSRLVRFKFLRVARWRAGNVVLRTTGVFRTSSLVARARNIVLGTTRVLGTTSLGWSMVGRSGFSGRYRSGTLKLSRPVGSGYRGPAVIDRSALLRVAAGSLLMLSLSRNRRDMSVTLGRFFFRPRTVVYPALAAVVADPVDGGVVDHRCVVNVGDVHIVDGAIVEKVSAVPASALIAVTEISESVIDPAVEPDMRPPIAGVEKKCAAAPTPPAGSPEEAGFGGQHPGARYPKVVGGVSIPGPIAGSPDVALGGARRLLVHGKGRRTEPDGYADADLGERSCGHRQHCHCH